MKQILSVLSLILVSIVVKAQSGNSMNEAVKNKGAALESRLIAIARKGSSISDSISYRYAPGRGGILSSLDATGNYGECYGYKPDLNELYYQDLSSMIRKFPELCYDTCYYRQTYQPGQSMTIITVRQYNHPGTEITEIRDQEANTGAATYLYHNKAVFTYNTNKQLTGATYYSDTAVNPNHNYLFVSGFKCHYLNNHIIRDSAVYDPDSKIIDYTYDSTGNLIRVSTRLLYPAGLYETYRLTFTYNAANRLVRRSRSVPISPNNMVEFELDSSKYNGTQLTSLVFYDRQLNQSSWWSKALLTFKYNSITGNIDSVLTFRLSNGFLALPTAITTVDYTPDDHIDKTHFYNIISGDSIHAKFYYDLYTPNKVSLVRQPDALAELYPIPVTDQLHIRLMTAGSKPVSVMVYNSQGQLVSEIADIRQLQYQLPVERLATGSYIAVIISGDVSQRIRFVKQ